MSSFRRFTDLAESLPPTVPFVGPETQERTMGTTFRARLGANENGFGPAPSVIEAMSRAAPLSWRYADPENYDLRQALSGRIGLAPERFVIGEGIDGLLGLVVRLIVGRDTPVVTSLGAYPTFNYHVAGFGGRFVTVPYRDDREDMDALLEAVRREDAPLVYLANPDNPMGSWHGADAVVEFATSLPESTLLVLDEAYCEFAPEDALPAIAALADMPNVIRFRTFSKAYGLAGQRIAYGFGTAGTISRFDRVRNHFGVNRLAQIAAVAALADEEWLSHVKSEVRRSLQRIGEIGRDNGLEPLPTATNFVALDCGDAARARAILEELAKEGVFIRMPGAAPLNRCIRISAGPAPEMDVLAEALPKALARIA
ncbi:pyridoxal phosphate-dependent aminotransferase [Pseudohoeflea suaedae]|uniref:histidinol-phosphate transaminase n=1 Tax=Pseudohoeflea suaedae TaxID=877384 RepID=A0A4R5PJP7_9HYPH|nr:pyridoxal phosphate-dependent aminotransferase [Pseudohoeflea suaedae]TDH35826.1 pyridoxal phosphate-dependent aminotransferase [Pseudohoeflea suaedae]